MMLMLTGTQKGMTNYQKRYVIKFVKYWNDADIIENVRHGDCIGADAQFHNIVRRVNPDIHIIIHPCNIEKKRAFCRGAYHICNPQEPLQRNINMVNIAPIVLVTPAEREEVRRSGTWATYRYAHKIGAKVLLIPPEISKFDQDSFFRRVGMKYPCPLDNACPTCKLNDFICGGINNPHPTATEIRRGYIKEFIRDVIMA